MLGTRGENRATEMSRDDIFDRTAEGLELRLIADGEIHNHGRRPPNGTYIARNRNAEGKKQHNKQTTIGLDRPFMDCRIRTT